MRVLITGSRTWRWRGQVYAELIQLEKLARAQGERLVIVVGDCPSGVDKFTAEWAKVNWNVLAEVHYANWEKHGKGAGFIRNSAMVDSGADRAIAFIHNHSHGATDCADKADKAGIPTMRLEHND